MKFSIILTTKNNKRTINHCIASIVDQLGTGTELVIVDNFSDDGTYEMMQNFANKHQNIILFQAGPERHIQRNKGFEASSGEWIYFIDSDMYVGKGLIDECLQLFEVGHHKAFIVPEKNKTGHGYWTNVKAFEREFYQGDDLTEAARIFERLTYESVGGFDSNMISCEDRELTERVRAKGNTIDRISHHVVHDEGEINLGGLLRKKMYYGGEAVSYVQHGGSTLGQIGKIIKRLYFFRPVFYTKYKLYKNRLHLVPGLIIMLTGELLFGFAGLVRKKFL